MFQTQEVSIQDNFPGGFSQYAITIPASATVGEYLFELMLRCTPKDKTKPEYLAKVRSQSHFQVAPDLPARLENVVPPIVEAANFVGISIRVTGTHLDQVSTSRVAYLNTPTTGRMSVRFVNESALMLTPTESEYPIKPGRYRVGAYLKTGGPCASTAYLTLE